jgi:hypothetical protein
MFSYRSNNKNEHREAARPESRMMSVIYIRKEHFRIFIRIRYSKFLYKIQVKFTIAYPDCR